MAPEDSTVGWILVAHATHSHEYIKTINILVSDSRKGLTVVINYNITVYFYLHYLFYIKGQHLNDRFSTPILYLYFKAQNDFHLN